MHKTTEAEKNDPRNAEQAKNGPYPQESDFLKDANKGCRVPKTKTGNKGDSPRGWEVMEGKKLPDSLDWGAYEANGRT